MREIVIAKDVDELNHIASTRIVDLAAYAIRTSSRFTVVLAGGSTPKALYRLLSSNEFSEKIDWSKVSFFFGDERCVPPDHPDSNYRMAKENLFDRLGTAPENIFRWSTEKSTAEDAAADYETTIKEFFPEDSLPQFDLILLGLGADGHTASLFPYSPALKELSRIAVANPVEKLGADRLTLTFPVINNAANIIFLISGNEKGPALKEILEGAPHPDKYPAQLIKPTNGTLTWFVDKDAAGFYAANDDPPTTNHH